MQGNVTDVQGHALAGVKLELTTKNGGTASAQTDSAGNYRFSVAEGTYTLRGESAGYESAIFGPFTLAKEEVKRINLTLRSKAQISSLGAPEFFDQPQFTIAGVTDTTSLGGHASGMAAPAESLAKDMASLSATSAPPPANLTFEQAACESAEKDERSFSLNHAAGKLLLEHRKPQQAIRYLVRAFRLNPEDYENSYELAQAYAGAGQYSDARALLRTLLAREDKADLHHLLANVEEKSGDPLRAVQEYEQAAKMDPSEANLFDWGMELLAHRAVEPALQVFRNGTRRFPQSVRMLTGLGVAAYDAGSYAEALQHICAAADLNPQNPNPYILLGKMQGVDDGQSGAPVVRLRRFAQLQPVNAWANYYYALALWKRRKGPEDVFTSAEVEALLQKSIGLDRKLAKAYLQLGILYAERKDLSRAISSYESAIHVDPQLEQAHYRLAQAYMASGQNSKGRQEIERYQEISKAKADTMERERREIRQFVYTLQDRPPQEQP